MTWLDAEPGPAALVIAALLLGYFVAVEPWWGQAVFAGLARSRPSDPRALLAFDRLTIGVQVATVAAVVVAVLLDPGVGAGSIGWRLPSAPADELLPLIVGGAIGLVLAAGAGLALGARAARRGRGLPVAPASISPMIPVTRTERWWAAALSIGAGVSE